MLDSFTSSKPVTPPMDVMPMPSGNLLGMKKASAAQVDKTANDFESMFLAQMLAPMWAGVGEDNEFGGGSAEETFRGMLINEYGKILSKSGGLGIASSVKAEILKLQEKQS